MGERKGEYSSILLALATAGVGVILAYALACAVLYGDETQGNILLSVDGGLAAGLKACMSVAVLFSLPIKMFPASQIVEEALFTHDTAAGEGAEEEGGGAAEAARGAQQAGGGHSHACGRTAARTALALVSLLTALSLPDFKFLVALSGALNVGVIAFVLPPLMYVLLARGAMRPASVAAHGLLCALGTVVTVLCTAMVVAQKLHPAGGELPPTPPPLDTYEVEDPLESYDWRAGG
uniref:Amino acid transporter transmembrane domain-containing protein n=2 Tax=Emiliania huxleyi TaxID=2903 RepID=A0A6V2Z9D5_EMIHU